MDIDAAVFGHLQQFLRQNLSVSGHHYNIRCTFSDIIKEFLVSSYLLGLQNLNAFTYSQFLYRSILDFFAPVSGLIRLCDNICHLMAAF